MRQGQQNRRGRSRSGRKPQNALSRNFESNGPNVKIRGTAAHIADKYLALARDALSSGDIIVAESYFQHAEHYNRIIMAAQSDKQNGADRQHGSASGNGRDHHDEMNPDSEDEEPAQGAGSATEQATSDADDKQGRRKAANGASSGASKAESGGRNAQRGSGRGAQSRRSRPKAESARHNHAGANGVGSASDDGAPEGFSA